MKRNALLSAVALCAAITSASFAACGKTAGAPATIDVVVTGGGATFDTAAGWHVTLTNAHLAIGPVYVYAPAGDMTASLLSALLPVARAHGGHDPLSGRAVRIEWLDQAAVDLLAPPTTVGTASGTAGMSDGLELLLDPPDAPNVAATHGHHFWVEGTATKATQTVAFEGGLDIPMESAISRAVEGVPLSVVITSGGTLTVHVLVARWLDEAQFDTLPAPATGTVREIVPGTQPYVAWTIDGRNAGAFSADYVAATAPTP